MALRFLSAVLAAFFLTAYVPSFDALAADDPVFVPNKLLCAKMIRFGREAYERGRFSDAKEFFRRATIADPESKKAWRFYDQSVLFALAEKVEAKENSDLLSAGTSVGSRFSTSEDRSTSRQQPIDAPTFEQLPEIATPVEEAMADDSEMEEEEEEEEEGC